MGISEEKIQNEIQNVKIVMKIFQMLRISTSLLI